jgi:hypothetical protein
MFQQFAGLLLPGDAARGGPAPEQGSLISWQAGPARQR